MANSAPVINPMRIAVCLVAEDIFGGEPLGLAACRQTMARFNFDQVLLRLVLVKHANDTVFAERPVQTDEQWRHVAALFRMLFDETHGRYAVEIVRQNADCFCPVSDQAILAAIELAGQCCPRTGGGDLQNNNDRLALSHVLLSLQSATLSARFKRRAARINSFAELERNFMEEFVRHRIAHNTSHPFGDCFTRLYAYCRLPEVREFFRRRTRQDLDEWCREALGMTAEQYVVAAFLASSCSFRFRFDQMPSTADFVVDPRQHFQALTADARDRAMALLELCTQPVASVGHEAAAMCHISEFVFAATSFHIHPAINFGPRIVCVSQTLMLNKFVSGVPQLLQSRREHLAARPLGGGEVAGSRGEFGALFEGYVHWLFRNWFAKVPGVTMHLSYEIQPTATTRNWAERDVLLVYAGTAFVFEVKATTMSLALRKTGEFSAVHPMVKRIVEQARSAAEALLAGRARTTAHEPIPAVRHAVPCGINYDGFPVPFPITDWYEPSLETETGLRLFTRGEAIAPLQFFGIEDVEAWESRFDFAREATAFFAALEHRAAEPFHRYERLRNENRTDNTTTRGGMFDRLGEDAFAFMKETARGLFQRGSNRRGP